MRVQHDAEPAGGCASRSTSSLSATIWSRASRRVLGEPIVLRRDRSKRPLGVGEPELHAAALRRRLGQPAPEVDDLGLEKAHLGFELLGRSTPGA